MWRQISLQASHCQAIIFQLLTTDSSHFFLRSVWGTFEKNPWRLTLKACFVWPKVQSVEMGLPKEKVGVKTEHLDTSGMFFGGCATKGQQFFHGLNSPRPCSDLLSFLANSGMETSKNVNGWPTAGPRWSATSSKCFDITELFDFAWDGREIYWIGDLNDTSKIFSNIQNIFKLLTLQEISSQLSVLRAKIQPTYVGTQALVFFSRFPWWS